MTLATKRQYRRMLFKLYVNDRDLIRSLTNIAYDYAGNGQALLIFEITLRFIFTSSSIFHLNLLYLIDDIFKERRVEYLEIFGPHLKDICIKVLKKEIKEIRSN
jgi:hypothetical protein